MKESIEQIARIAKEAGLTHVSFSVSDAATQAIAAMPGAYKRATVYVPEKESPYVIEAVNVSLNGVTIEAQAKARPATKDEANGEGDWQEHTSNFAARVLLP